MHSFILAALAVTLIFPLTPAYFLLVFLASRGLGGNEKATFPCGGYDTNQTNCTLSPLFGGETSLEMADAPSNEDGGKLQLRVSIFLSNWL